MSYYKRPLTLLDFSILAILFFGYFAAVSLYSYLGGEEQASPDVTTTFSDEANWLTIGIELILLTIAALFLWWRRFDFSLLNFSVNHSTPLWVVIVALTGGLISDVVLYGNEWIMTGNNPLLAEVSSGNSSLWEHITLGLILFSLLNGFFEELFFLGLTFAVKTEHRGYALIASVFIRFIFHTYQGLWAAFAIAMGGVAFILLRQKIHSLVPFMLAHALFDVFGAGVISFLL